MKKEDLFYIVLAIGWILYSLYKKNEKAKLAQQKLQQQQQTQTENIEQTETPPANSFLDMLLQGIDSADNYTKPQEPVYSEPLPQSIPVEKPLPYKDKKSAILEGDNTERQIQKERFKHNLHLEMNHQTNLDLRQAMIYNIILNRPIY